MHELAITEGILEAAVPAAEKAGAKKILEIRMKIGVLSGVIPSCIEEYLQLTAKGSIAEGAKLVVEPIPITVKCRKCGAASEVERKSFLCRECGSDELTITGGREYFLDSLKVE